MELIIPDIKGETRDGYFVPALMKRFWKAQLVVLKEIDRICVRHGLKWYASWGTCLGAARHGGFIPWDDDVDIEMPRKDYEIFKRCCATELEKPYVIGDMLMGNFDHLVSRVVNHEAAFCLEQDFLEKFYGCPYQAGVDIFCVDHIPDDPDEDFLMCRLVEASYNLSKTWDETDPSEREEMLAFLTETVKLPCPEGTDPRWHCLYMADRISAMYVDDVTENSAIISYYYRNSNRKIPTAAYDDMIYLPFEDIRIPVLKEYDMYLTRMLGDWRTPAIWGEHPYLSGRVKELEDALAEQGERLPEAFDLIKDQ